MEIFISIPFGESFFNWTYYRYLWKTERLSIFHKGLTARMTASSIYSLAVILGYESVKKMSVLPEYKVGESFVLMVL